MHSLADELARSTVRDIEELMLTGQAMLEAATSPAAAAALFAIRRVLVQRLRDVAEPMASASASPSASPTPSASAAPQLLVTAELHQAGEASAWDFIAHMQSIAAASSRQNMTAAMAALLAGGDDELGTLQDDERALLQAFADDATVFGLGAALAGLALRIDLTNWAACVRRARTTAALGDPRARINRASLRHSLSSIAQIGSCCGGAPAWRLPTRGSRW